jgi:elongation factor P
MIEAGQLRPGNCFMLEGNETIVLTYNHVKPGKGPAFVRMKLRNVVTGAQYERTFRPEEKFEDIRLERREMQYLYSTGEMLVFMDMETFDQFEIPRDFLGDDIGFLPEEAICFGSVAKGKILGIELPRTIDVVITQTDPGIKGDTASGGTKPAVIETGGTVNVPLFIQQGEKIKVDTYEKKYLERVK